MKALKLEAVLIIGALAAAAGALWWFSRQGNAAAVGESVGGAAVDLVTGAVSGAVLTIGDGVGLPRVDETECAKALREGRTWDSSFVCPAGTFIDSLFN